MKIDYQHLYPYDLGRVVDHLDTRLDRIERVLEAYLTEGRDANFAAREAALSILNEER